MYDALMLGCTVFTLKKVNRLNRLKSAGDTVRELYIQPIANKTRRRRRKTRAKKVKDVSEWRACYEDQNL